MGSRAMGNAKDGPLKGVNVLDVGTAGVGPWATTLLGYLGANVVKVESPAGDWLVHAGAPVLMKGIAPVYTVLNLNKKLAALDLKDPANKKVMERLVQQADIVMDNLRPGVVERLGLGYEAVKQINPAIISASTPAWGTEGPMKNIPGMDAQVQVFSGFASLNGRQGDRPELLRFQAQLDLNASCFFVCSVLLGLIQRERTGMSQNVSSAHLASAITLLITRIAESLATGVAPGPNGDASASSAPHQYFHCEDGRYLAVGVESDEQWQRFCAALGHDEWLDDPRFKTNRSRVQHSKELGSLIQADFGRIPSRWWVIKLEEARVPYSYLCDDFDPMLRFHQQIVENQYMVQVDVPHQGELSVGGLPWTFEKTPPVLTQFPPSAPGQDTDEVVRSGFGTPGAFTTLSAPEANGASEPPLPLAGLRVIEACQGMVGPMAGLLLAEAGAEVIKVEPPNGDYARGWAPALPGSDDSAIFVQLNRNKKSIILDLETETDRAVLRDMVHTAAIFLEDWGPGVAESLGLGYNTLCAENSRLLYAAITAHGEKGPLRAMPASELTIQAWTGYWSTLGQMGQRPLRVGADIVGVDTGVMTFLGILAALYHCQKTGEGQRLSTSMLGTMMCLRSPQWATCSDPDSWGGHYTRNAVFPPLHGYQTKDRPIYWSLNNASEEQYLALLHELGMLDSVIEDSRFGSGGRDAVGAGQFSHEVMDVWERFFSRYSDQEVLDMIHSHGGMGTEMRRLDELFDHPQVQTLNLLEHDGDGNAFLRAPWRGAWQRTPIVSAPRLGQHNDELLRRLSREAVT